MIELWLTFNSVGAGTAAVLAGYVVLHHFLASTGLSTSGTLGFQPLQVTSAGFNSAVSNSIIGVSLNGGASAAFTIPVLQSQLLN
jgi:hypothetical protein